MYSQRIPKNILNHVIADDFEHSLYPHEEQNMLMLDNTNLIQNPLKLKLAEKIDKPQMVKNYDLKKSQDNFIKLDKLNEDLSENLIYNKNECKQIDRISFISIKSNEEDNGEILISAENQTEQDLILSNDKLDKNIKKSKKCLKNNKIDDNENILKEVIKHFNFNLKIYCLV